MRLWHVVFIIILIIVAYLLWKNRSAIAGKLGM